MGSSSKFETSEFFLSSLEKKLKTRYQENFNVTVHSMISSMAT